MQQVIYTLLNYINNSITHDTYYHIAMMILEQIDQIEHYSLEKMAMMCHVSPATINRFCRQIGYLNYSTFRKMVSYKETKIFDDQILDNHYLNSYSQAIFEFIETVNDLNLNQLDPALACLNSHKRILAMGYGSYQNYALDLQKSFFSCGKFIEVYMDQIRQNGALATMTKEDVVIVTSLSGQYLKNPNLNVLKKIKQTGCSSILITLMRDQTYLEPFDYVIQCGNIEKAYAGKYAIIRLYDLMASRYQQLYCPIIKE